MRSLTLVILSEIFLREIEEKHFENLKLKYNIIMIAQNVNNVLMIYKDYKHNDAA